MSAALDRLDAHDHPRNDLHHDVGLAGALLASLRDCAVVTLRRDGTVHDFSEGATAVYGWDRSEVLRRNCAVLFPPGEASLRRAADLVERALRTGRVEERGWRMRKDGSHFWAHAVLTALRDRSGAVRGVVEVTRDLSEHEARAVERDELIAVAAHELRTPLTALVLRVQSLAELLRRQPGSLSPRVSERIGGALRQTDRLTELVERLLDVSRAANGSLVLSPQESDLVAVVRSAVAAVAEESPCSVRVAAPRTLLGRWDRARLEEAVACVVASAVKLGQGRPVDVRVEATVSAACVVVAFPGDGIPDAEARRMLCLFIARAVVEAHGGTLRMARRDGEGATVCLELPRFSPPEPPHRTEMKGVT